MAPRTILYTGQGRSREDERRGGHRAPLRRGRTAHRRALNRPGPQPVRLARGPARGRADPGRREPVRPGGAGPGGDGAPLGRRAGLARRPARRARHRPHLGRGADRAARHGRALLAALDQAPPRGGRVRLRDRGLRADRRDAAPPVVPRRGDLVARAHPALAAQARAVRAHAVRHPAARRGRVRGRGAPGAQPRGDERHPPRPLAHDHPARDEPGPDGGEGGDADLHLPEPLRLPDRRGGGEPAAAARTATSPPGARRRRSSSSWCARPSRRCPC